ncbi:SNF1-related protein kinase regulatory subunit gamma-like PV42a isoform X1 [Panicum virgatum]|uniref:SNF1-related protein kinase regulatory subunit gamma-like PV42a isoform X1 n=1 Tax=Panicum virgatum TaxID=38727 RepID=UPI0019D691B8|nr:SNF1-related protein kinase regulatory subunit gamma-like PV42a isoform X1 [Panicum virgatum]
MAQLRAPADDQRQQEALHGDKGGVDVAGGGGGNESNKKASAGLCGVLRERKVVDLARAKRRLVEVPYTATLAHTANALLAARVSAVAVAAPPGHWIGAGGSMILESDPATGAVRKHYIGMVNMLDILAHIAEAGDEADADDEAVDLGRRMAVPVSSVIGHSLEGLTLWTLHPNTSVLDCMETFSKGVHRALVPLESSADNVVAVELVESAPGYRMVTQMDVVRFLRAHGAELRGVLSRTVRELGAVSEAVFAVASGARVIDAVKAMRAASLTAVPVVDAAAVGEETLQDVCVRSSSDEHIGAGGDDISCLFLLLLVSQGVGKKAVETFSATDLRDCPVARLQPWLGISVTEFKRKVAEYRASNKPVVHGADATGTGVPVAADADAPAAAAVATDEEQSDEHPLVTCSLESTLCEAIEAAVTRHVHRLWAVDGDGLLRGVMSLTDVLRAVREAALGEDRELHSIVPS